MVRQRAGGGGAGLYADVLLVLGRSVPGGRAMMANYDGLADFASGVLRSVLIIGGFVVGGLALAGLL
jgi:hypothetical protein